MCIYDLKNTNLQNIKIFSKIFNQFKGYYKIKYKFPSKLSTTSLRQTVPFNTFIGWNAQEV